MVHINGGNYNNDKQDRNSNENIRIYQYEHNLFRIMKLKSIGTYKYGACAKFSPKNDTPQKF